MQAAPKWSHEGIESLSKKKREASAYWRECRMREKLMKCLQFGSCFYVIWIFSPMREYSFCTMILLLCYALFFFGSVCFFFDYCYYYCCSCCWFILVTLISIALGFFMVARAISALKRISYWSLCERSSLDRSSVYLIHMLMAFELIRFG